MISTQYYFAMTATNPHTRKKYAYSFDYNTLNHFFEIQNPAFFNKKPLFQTVDAFPIERNSVGKKRDDPDSNRMTQAEARRLGHRRDDTSQDEIDSNCINVFDII